MVWRVEPATHGQCCHTGVEIRRGHKPASKEINGPAHGDLLHNLSDLNGALFLGLL